MSTNQPTQPGEIDPPGASPSRWRRARWDEPETIYFWSGRGGRFAAFSNFAPTPFEMPAWHDPARIAQFATGEHAFQAAKASTPNEHERIPPGRHPA